MSIDDPDKKDAKVDAVEPTDERTTARPALFRFRAKIGERQFYKLLTVQKLVEWYDRDIPLDGDFD
jgi:hypothetical protein